MKLTVLIGILGLGLGLSGTAGAAPLCVAGGTMASYEALGAGGCTIGDRLFSNFGYASTAGGNGVMAPDTAVFLTPVVPAGAGFYNPGPGIIFSSAVWMIPSASPELDSFVDSSISFTVSALDSDAWISGGTLTLTSFSQSGTGFADIAETLNPLGLQLHVNAAGPDSQTKTFAPRNSISVLKDLILAVPSGTELGTAQIFSFEEDFSQGQVSPEPVGVLLMGSGLIALGIWRRRADHRS